LTAAGLESAAFGQPHQGGVNIFGGDLGQFSTSQAIDPESQATKRCPVVFA
jgi:hypothetical protein